MATSRYTTSIHLSGIVLTPTMQEASTGVVDLEDDEPEIVAHMIDFLYKDDYTVVNPTNPVIPGGQTSSRSMVNVLAKFKDPVITHVKVYLIVDKYDIQPLKKLVCQRYKSNQYEVYCNPTFVSGLQLLYDNTVVQDTMLKRVLLTIAAENADSLWEDDEFRELCTANGAIAFDMLDARLKLSKDPDTLRIDVPECPCCYLTEDVFVEIWSCRSCNCVVGRNSTNTYLA